MTELEQVLWIIYFVIAAIICVWVWIDSSCTYYRGDPPSGLFVGLFWPVWGAIILVVWTVIWIQWLWMKIKYR